jgi:hypothetical protein
MASVPAVFVFIAFSMAAAIALYAAYDGKLRRRTVLTRRAAIRSGPFLAAKDDSHDLRYAHFAIFKQGENRYAFNTIRGELDVEGEFWLMQSGHYHFATMEPEGEQLKPKSHTLSYVLIETPYLGLPDLLIRAETLLDKMTGCLSNEDIDFESAQFSDRFVVTSRDKRFAYDVLHPRMIEFLLDHGPPTIDFRRGQCCLSQGEKCWTVEEFQAVFDWASKFFALWPRHVITSIAERFESLSLQRKG